MRAVHVHCDPIQTTSGREDRLGQTERLQQPQCRRMKKTRVPACLVFWILVQDFDGKAEP
jgi:hypothetical protein